MPGNDLDLALRIRADVQQALVGMRNMDRSLGNIDKRGKRADRTMRSMVRTALRLGGAYLGFRAVIGVFRSVIAKTEEQAQAIAQVERGLRNLDRQTTLTSAGLQAHRTGVPPFRRARALSARGPAGMGGVASARVDRRRRHGARGSGAVRA